MTPMVFRRIWKYCFNWCWQSWWLMYLELLTVDLMTMSKREVHQPSKDFKCICLCPWYVLTQFHSRADLLHVLRHLLQPNVQQARHRQALPGFPAALQVWYYFFHVSFQNISFQNRAQDEYHKCHTIGEIYFQFCQLNLSHWIPLFVSLSLGYKFYPI